MTLRRSDGILCRHLALWATHNYMTDKYILVLCTCPEDVVAARIANTLVEERLAACVNRLSRMTSTYRWEGKVQSETEALLMIKTTAGLLERLGERIKELHPYELPEVIALPIEGGSERYLAWLGQSVAT
jgi:periplasmic divalent cation tolerance protein